MKRSLRKLRIAWSVGCAIACVLLIVLWVRSYRIADGIWCPVSGSDVFGLFSAHGTTTAFTNDLRSGYFKGYWEIRHDPIADPHIIDYHLHAHSDYRGAFGFGIIHSPPLLSVGVPHWFLIVLAVSFAVLPWGKWRFSLRTLLIATTLVAVVLGLAVYAASN